MKIKIALFYIQKVPVTLNGTFSHVMTLVGKKRDGDIKVKSRKAVEMCLVLK